MATDPNTVSTPAGAQAGSPQQAPGSQSPGVSNGEGSTAEQDKASRSKLLEGLEHHKSRADTAEAELKKYREAESERDRKAKEEQGQWQTLYQQEKQAREQEKQAREELARKIETDSKRTALMVEGMKLGLVDSDALALIDLAKVKVEGDKVTNAADVLAEFKQSKPYLFGGTGKNGTPFPTPQATPGGSASELLDLKKFTTRQQHEEARKKDPKGYLEAMRRLSNSG